MYANGFFEQQRRSPVSLAAVIGLHGAAIAVLALYGTTQFVANKAPITHIFNVPIDEPPPPDPPPPPQPQTDQRVQTPPERITVPPANNPPLGAQTGTATPERPYQPPTTPQGPQLALNTTPAVPPPVRRAAQVDPNYRDALQPPYPRAMEQAQRNGSVQVRITIGTDGRVSAVEQLSASDDAFWRVTQRQALGRWRFRPATVDGRPIVSTMVMTVTFRIPDDG
jgi:protein TonB